MPRFLLSTAFVAALATAAMHGMTVKADRITLDAPTSGATLRQGGVAMSVYFMALDDGAYEIVAIYAAEAEPGSRHRLTMALNDGDSVSFALPGHPGALYRFERRGDMVTVGVETIGQTLPVP